jgi:hypothetical protein
MAWLRQLKRVADENAEKSWWTSTIRFIGKIPQKLCGFPVPHQAATKQTASRAAINAGARCSIAMSIAAFSRSTPSA